MTMPVWIPAPGDPEKYVRKDDPGMEPLTSAELARLCWADVVRGWMDRQYRRVVGEP